MWPDQLLHMTRLANQDGAGTQVGQLAVAVTQTNRDKEERDREGYGGRLQEVGKGSHLATGPRGE